MRILRIVIVLALVLGAGMAGAANLDGFVLDAKSRPVSDSFVYVYAAAPKVGVSALCPTCYRDCGKRVAAGVDGSFHLSGLDPALTFDLLAVADGYEPTFLRRVDPSRGAVKLSLSIRSVEEMDRVITGFVEGPDGKPVLGAVVEPRGYRIGGRIGYGAIPGLEQVSITDRAGEFQLRMPDAGAMLDVRVTAPSMAPYIERMLEPGTKRRICMTDGVAIYGRVMKEGKPVAGVPILATQEDHESSQWLGRFTIGTDEDGRFVISDLAPDETWVVGVQARDLPAGVVEPVVVRTGELGKQSNAGTLEVRRGRRVAGAITLPQGAAVENLFDVYVVRWPSGDLLSGEISIDGSFAFTEVPNGIVWLEVRANGLRMSSASTYFNQIWQTIVLPEKGDLTNLHLVLEPEVE